MERFTQLLNGLLLTPSRSGKLNLMARYLQITPDPDRGWALAALTGAVDFPAIKAGTVRALMAERVDPVLWSLSRDFVGDTAETASLLWPASDAGEQIPPPSLGEVVKTLANTTRASAPGVLAELLDQLDTPERYALIKFATGALRIGVSARLAKVAFAQAFGVPVDAVEEYWHGQRPPYAPLFGWATGAAPPPRTDLLPLFRPFMLAHPLENEAISLKDYAAEWKWDGIRVQIVHVGGETRVYSRGGDEISGSFPEIASALRIPAVLDGELLVRGAVQGGETGGAGSFNALQQRLGRKSVSRSMLAELPAFVRLYDLLIENGEDLRELPWCERRARLEALVPRLDPEHFDLSDTIDAKDMDTLAEIRAGARDAAIEGVILKHRQSPYVAGRRTGFGTNGSASLCSLIAS